MTPRRLSRWLAPLALLAALLAVFMVVTTSTQNDDGDGDEAATTTAPQEERRQNRARRRGTTTGGRTETGARTATGPEQETYTIRPGDTLNVISERTGVPVEELEALNPDVDPNNLPVGEKIKLTE